MRAEVWIVGDFACATVTLFKPAAGGAILVEVRRVRGSGTLATLLTRQLQYVAQSHSPMTAALALPSLQPFRAPVWAHCWL